VSAKLIFNLGLGVVWNIFASKNQERSKIPPEKFRKWL
jgi:hypothetical protein